MTVENWEKGQAPMTREYLRAAIAAARNLLLGGNLALPWSARWRPRRMVRMASETLFLHAAMAQRRGLPERHVFDVVRGIGVSAPSDLLAVTLSSHAARSNWMGAVGSYTVDLVSLCLLARLAKAQTVFEIGTYEPKP